MVRTLLIVVAVSGLSSAAHADCKYDQLAEIGAMSKEQAQKYCKAEALKVQAEVQFKEASDKCHSKYNKINADGGELSKCLSDAQAKFNDGISAMQTALKGTEPAQQRAPAAKNGPFEHRDGNTLERGQYVKGKLDGKIEETTFFDKDADTQHAGKEDERRVYTYVKGKRQGHFERYSEGKLVEKGQYRNDAEVGTWEYLEDGRWYKRIYCNDGVVIDSKEGGAATCENPVVGG